MKKIWFFILLSLFFHLNSYFGLGYFVNHWLSEPATRQDLTQIDLVEKTKPIKTEKAKMLVTQIDTKPDNLLDSNALAQFESATRQRVLKETRVAQLGLPKNNPGNSSQPDLQKQQESRHEFEDAVLKKQNPFPQGLSRQTSGSSFNQDLPNDIDLADATNLNTDANIYYSFYNRVQELFYIRWVENLNSIWNRIPEDFKIKELSNRNWSTILEIWLKKNGEFHSAHLLKGSGYDPFDQAPVKAFKDARFFPNPPPAKVEEDGLIRLKYRFTVQVGPYR